MVFILGNINAHQQMTIGASDIGAQLTKQLIPFNTDFRGA
jgi:hypothetical protein